MQPLMPTVEMKVFPEDQGADALKWASDVYAACTDCLRCRRPGIKSALISEGENPMAKEPTLNSFPGRYGAAIACLCLRFSLSCFAQEAESDSPGPPEPFAHRGARRLRDACAGGDR